MEPEQVLSDEQIASIKSIIQEVYKEEASQLVIEGTDDQQEETMRSFVERVALRVAAICLAQVDQSSDEATEMHVGADDMTDLITNLLRYGNASIKLMITTE